MRSSLVTARGLGLDVHIACNTMMADKGLWAADCEQYGVVSHHIDFDRIPYRIGNFKALHQLRELIRILNPDIIHCNTPIGGIVGRFAALDKNVVLYQAHGFHFWRGAPLVNWLLYYPIEKVLSRRTDIILTINHDDRILAQRRMRPRVGVRYVPGVGIRLRNPRDCFGASTSFIRQKLGLSDDAMILLSVGELNANKNHELIIEAMGLMSIRNLHLVILGQGHEAERLTNRAHALGLTSNVHLEGFCSNVDSYYYGADIFVMPSKREGLPVSLMEAMSCGLPCVVSNIRGNRDLIEDGENGFLCDVTASSFSTAIRRLVDNRELRASYGERAAWTVRGYSFESSCSVMKEIYQELSELVDGR